MADQYVSTVVPPGYSRYAIRMGGVLLGACDIPVGYGGTPVEYARRWLLGEEIPEPVKFWPAPNGTRDG